MATIHDSASWTGREYGLKATFWLSLRNFGTLTVAMPRWHRASGPGEYGITYGFNLGYHIFSHSYGLVLYLGDKSWHWLRPLTIRGQ